MIDFTEFILNGTFGPFGNRESSERIIDYFGEPEIHTPAHKSYSEMIVYGDLEFRLRNDQLNVIALDLQSPKLPERIEIEGLPEGMNMALKEVEDLLRRHGVQFSEDSIMSDESQLVLVTENGVHLAFVDQSLVRIVAEYV